MEKVCTSESFVSNRKSIFCIKELCDIIRQFLYFVESKFLSVTNVKADPSAKSCFHWTSGSLPDDPLYKIALWFVDARFAFAKALMKIFVVILLQL